MKERPILFNTEMVKAVLSGRKTQTRRVVKPQPYKYKFGSIGQFVWRWLYKKKYEFQDKQNWINHCPYGQVGDRLWVRETWQSNKDKTKFIYKAGFTGRCDDDILYGWKPSIHMPRWASRINLEITNIRVERVQDITRCDIRAEGLTPPK